MIYRFLQFLGLEDNEEFTINDRYVFLTIGVTFTIFMGIVTYSFIGNLPGAIETEAKLLYVLILLGSVSLYGYAKYLILIIQYFIAKKELNRTTLSK